MIERVHQHLLSELERATRADTVFVVCAVLFNILALFISWTQANDLHSGYGGSIRIFLLVIAASLVVSGAALVSLLNSRKTCADFHASLIRIYKDSDMLKYFPAEAVAAGNKRFVLSFIVVVGTSIFAIGIPYLAYAGA